jgi:nucleoid-associated protein YgaU
VAAAKPAAAINIPLPDQAQKNAAASPALRPASTQPEASAAHGEAADTARADTAKADNAGASQPEGTAAPAAGAKYKVVRGDMLSQIALQVYGDASKFRMIQAANPSLRNKPDRILVDQVIFLPPDKR